MSQQGNQLVFGVRDKAAEVAFRRQLLEKERELKLQAKLREQDDKLRRVEEQKTAELHRKAKLRAQKELEKAKAVLDRKQAQLEADKNRKAEILQRAHQAASRTAQTSPAKVYAFGSSTPRELSYLERLARDQKTPPRVGTTTTTPKKSPVPSSMTTSCYVPRVAVTKPTESKPATVKPAATRRSPTVNAGAPKAKVDRMSASMYTPTTPASRRSLAPARLKREEQQKKTMTPPPAKPSPAPRRPLPPRPPVSKAPAKEATPAKNPIIAALSVPKKILPKKVVEQQAPEPEKVADAPEVKKAAEVPESEKIAETHKAEKAETPEPEKVAEVSVEKAADAVLNEQAPAEEVVEAVKHTENNNTEARQEVPNVEEDVLVEELHNLKLTDCSTPEPNEEVEHHDSGIGDSHGSEEALLKNAVLEEALPAQQEESHHEDVPIEENKAHEEAESVPIQEEEVHQEAEAVPVQEEEHHDEALPTQEEEHHDEAVSIQEAESHEEVVSAPQDEAVEQPIIEEPQAADVETHAEAEPIAHEVPEELVESEPKSVSELIETSEHVAEPVVENGIHDLETDRPSVDQEPIQDEAATEDLNTDNGTVEAASESFNEAQVTTALPSAPFVNLDFVESSAPFTQESPVTPDSDAPVDPAVAPVIEQTLVDIEEPKPVEQQPAVEVPLFQELAEAATKPTESVPSVEPSSNGDVQTNGLRTSSPDSSASSTKGSSDAENVPVSEPESRSDMKARLNALMSRVRDPNVSPTANASPKGVDGRALARALLEQRRNGNGVSPTAVLRNLTLSEEMAVAGEKAQQHQHKSVMDVLPGQVYEDEHAPGKKTPPEDPAHAVV